MNFILLLPVFLSSLLMAAHCLRNGWGVLAVCSLGVPFLLIVAKKWAARCVQVFLLIGTAEWLRSLLVIVSQRIDMEMSWGRLVIILGSVAVFTGLSGCVFFIKPLAKRYKL